ncbi:MAG: PilN domain-containing protein [Candidatus Latescibacteria bacterium]|nr:PilN domain-containing protein [Candidatus Latescibacterota bacterium]
MYIEINLLPEGFRPKKTLIKLDYKFVLTLVIIMAAGGVGWYYLQTKKALEQVNGQIAHFRQEEAKIRDRVQLDNEVKALGKDVEARVGIVKELTGGSDSRYLMLDYINKVLPGNLWLSSINEIQEGARVFFNIEGMSYSKDDVSQLLEDLESFKKFTSVSLESIKPSPMEIRDAFDFIIRVELKTPQPPVEKEDQKSSRRSRRRRK